MTNTLTITAAYVWQCASDFRANSDISDELGFNVSAYGFSLCDVQGDLDSVASAASMLDDPTYRSQPNDDQHIVSANGTYRGVPVRVQGLFSDLDAALNALRAGGR
jgi:hypothetical protein